ncbi:MAG TPA: hypothetical protein VIX14_01450, partial [Terriglobales bacterium]
MQQSASASIIEQQASVLLPLPLDHSYDYTLPAGVMARRGMLVRAPLGSRQLVGVVWGAAQGGIADDKIKACQPLGHARLPESLCNFVDWMAQYTLARPGAVLAQALRVHGLFDERPQQQGLAASMAAGKSTPARQRVYQLMRDSRVRSAGEIAKQANVRSGVISAMVKSGQLRRVELPDELCPEPDHSFDAVKLTFDQLRAAEHLREAVRKRQFSVTLLDG